MATNIITYNPMIQKYCVLPNFLNFSIKINCSVVDYLLQICKKNNFHFEHLKYMLLTIKPKTYNLKWSCHPRDGLIGFNIFECHADCAGGIPNIISSQFLFVHPKYRKKGIATELLKLPDICDNPIFRVECKKPELQFFDKQGYKFKRLSKTGEYLVLEK